MEETMANANDQPITNIEDLWDASDVARFLKVSRSWVYYRAGVGVLPSLRVGGLLRFDPPTVRAFARGEIQPSKVLRFPKAPSTKGP
jgi:hypothetical protein